MKILKPLPTGRGTKSPAPTTAPWFSPPRHVEYFANVFIFSPIRRLLNPLTAPYRPFFLIPTTSSFSPW